MISIIIFSILLIIGFGYFAVNANKIRTNILMGRDVDRSDNKGERFKVMSLIALGQKKMFKRPIPAVLHLCLYVAFIITQIELIEIIADGLSGEHRVFRSSLGAFYTFMISFIEILSVLAFVATFIFLLRRNMIKVPRLNMKEMKGWPKLDGNMILFMELILVTFIFMMNGADEVLYNRGLSHAEQLNDESFGFAVSQFVGPALFGGMSESSLHLIERIGWWGHIVMVFTFLNYLPFSKHFHIILAFPNTYFSNLNPQGQFTNMDAVMKEVKLMMDPDADPYAEPEEPEGEPQRFGAKDVEDLTWKNLLDSYTCTECGRCTSNCPANRTGKLLSPRKIMMDTRDRLEEKGKGIRKNGKDYDDGKSLLNDYITEEELWACTTCNACVEACPVNIDPLSIIMDMRRYLVMEESKVPTELAGMTSNIENNGAPWQFSPDDRLNWKDED
ncbi:(Fe-S)-binding protein [Brumimicrobium aurantiacum]|uniref:(Fe-S)-binding protein n=1 Tax=Brumimicrobium aurantiacum TaxID=1737063 RepID=A0A3E1EWK8_9FLAO|nr:(Fe-S)-binding protein [Brumimicrobium aurantiacum]RFC53944.1 (Fe-S)-binding protein [Brumimicrobium aurantiacum]